jgi:tRNA(fMet)-specific endonuclease VapC
MLVLDTDLVPFVQLGSGEVYERLNDRLEAASATEMVCVTIISFEEQARGWLSQVAKAREPEQQIPAYRRLRTLLGDYSRRTVLDFDAAAVPAFQKLKKAKIKVGTMDLKIATVALANDATLLSRNLRDFEKVPGLRVEDRTVPPKD